MSPGINAGRATRLGVAKLVCVALACVAPGPTALPAGDRPAIDVQDGERAICGAELEPAQAGGDEERGCCVIVTDTGPRCAYASRGYCSMRAAEAGLPFEFHVVASCSDLPQCR